MSNKLSLRYTLTPQMKIYDDIGEAWKPFIMYLSRPNFRSNVVNLDQFGLRFNDLNAEKKLEIEKNNSIFNEKIFSSSKDKAALIGNSSAFGVGAGSDSSTLSSILSQQTNYHFFNLGGRAFSGFQETILFQSLINQLSSVKKIVIFSGANDLFLTNHLSVYDPILGPYYYNSQFVEGMNISTTSWKRNLARFLLDPFVKNNVDWNLITKKELINNLSKKKMFEPKFFDKEKILKNLIKKNLSYWSNIQKGMGIKIIFVLQPMAQWCGKELSDEEKQIFNELDSSNKNTQTLKSLDISKYKSYKDSIAELCNYLNIEFVDSSNFINKKNFHKEWLFVDRIHLTDLGYKYIAELILSKF